MAYESGFECVPGPASTREGPSLNLYAPSGLVAATVFLTRDASGHNWFVWDRNGTGGENSVEPTVEQAKITAESAVLRWGQHFVTRTKRRR